MGIYRKALGPDFDRLGDALVAFHSKSGHASGQLTVTHSRQFIPRFFVWLMRLPKEGVDLQTELTVDQTETTEVWSRQIGKTKLVTRQRTRDGRLLEQAGPLVFEFGLEEQGGAMVFHTYRSKLLGIPIPARIAPMIEASTAPFEGGWNVLVNIQCPRYGTICRYEGRMVIQ